MANYILHFNASNEPFYPFWDMGAAGKCHLDRETFLREIGFRQIDAFFYRWDGEPKDALNARLDGILGGLQRNDCLIVQWPFPDMGSHWIQTFINRVHDFNTKLIFLIDDISSWQLQGALPNPNNPAEVVKKLKDPNVTSEITFLKQTDGIIAHSKQMADHLREELALAGQKMTTNVTWFGPGGHKTRYFQGRRHFDQGIDYAGALYKAVFLLQLPDTLKLNVYGARPKDEKLAENQNISLHPLVDPEAMPQLLKGSYGLVWDSEQYPEVVGSLGEYEQYNTPAKFAMYLAADEPVIVWSKASTAKFVKENGIGIVIDSLDQLPQKVGAIDQAAYNRMLDNVQRISPLIRDGFFLKEAVFNVMRMVYDKANDVK